jgi:hypothetical protein
MNREDAKNAKKIHRKNSARSVPTPEKSAPQDVVLSEAKDLKQLRGSVPTGAVCYRCPLRPRLCLPLFLPL